MVQSQVMPTVHNADVTSVGCLHGCLIIGTVRGFGGHAGSELKVGLTGRSAPDPIAPKKGDSTFDVLSRLQKINSPVCAFTTYRVVQLMFDNLW